jgi:hypothetical protein
VVEAGAIPRMLGVAGDTKADLLDKLKRGLEEDVLLVSEVFRWAIMTW